MKTVLALILALPSTLHNVSWLATHGGFEAVTFLNSGDDNKGAILDDVRLETAETQTAPEPETSLLLGVSMVGLGWLFRRRRLADADHAARVEDSLNGNYNKEKHNDNEKHR